MVEIILVYHDSLLESLSEFDGGGCFEDLICLTTIKNENCANVWNLWSTIYGSVSIRMYVLISVLKKTRNVSKLLYNRFERHFANSITSELSNLQTYLVFISVLKFILAQDCLRSLFYTYIKGDTKEWWKFLSNNCL